MTRLPVAALLLLAAVAPASASANLLQSDPVTVGAYKLQLRVANHGARAGGDVVLWRRVGSSRQEHRYHIDSLSYSYMRDLRSAHVRRTLRGGGRIDLVFHGGRGARVDGTGPCDEDGAAGRRGTLTGTFRFPVGDRYFHTLRRIGATAVLGPPRKSRASASDPLCFRGGEQTGNVFLYPRTSGRGVRFDIGDYGPTRIQVTVKAPAGPAGPVTHTILARGPDGAFTSPGVDDQAPDDQARVTAFGPFLTGALRYTATENDPTVNYGTFGTVTGDLRARFDSIGPVAPPSGSWGLYLSDSGH